MELGCVVGVWHCDVHRCVSLLPGDQLLGAACEVISLVAAFGMKNERWNFSVRPCACRSHSRDVVAGSRELELGHDYRAGGRGRLRRMAARRRVGVFTVISLCFLDTVFSDVVSRPSGVFSGALENQQLLGLALHN